MSERSSVLAVTLAMSLGSKTWGWRTINGYKWMELSGLIDNLIERLKEEFECATQ